MENFDVARSYPIKQPGRNARELNYRRVCSDNVSSAQ